jgi:hypothetical protein
LHKCPFLTLFISYKGACLGEWERGAHAFPCTHPLLDPTLRDEKEMPFLQVFPSGMETVLIFQGIRRNKNS